LLSAFLAATPLFGWRFVSFGDSRGSSISNYAPPSPFTSIVNHITALNPAPDFVVFVGDAFYGYVDDITQMRAEWTDWKTRVQPITSLGIPLYLCVGNHEGNCGGTLDGSAVFAAEWPSLPDNGPSDLVRQVYTFRHNNAQFFCLNTDVCADQSRIGSNQRSWLNSILDTCTAQLNFAYGHEPGYPDSPTSTSSLQRYPSDRNAFWQILTTHHFIAYICGHLHEWNRDFFAHANMPADTTVHQVIDGTCGAPIYHGEGGEFYHYLVWDIDGTRCMGRLYDNSSALRDSFVYNGRSGIEIEGPVPPPWDARLRAQPAVFSDQVHISYIQQHPAHISISIYGPDGEELVRNLYSGMVSRGRLEFTWDGRDLAGQEVPSGNYFIVLESAQGEFVARKLVRVK